MKEMDISKDLTLTSTNHTVNKLIK